VGLREGMPGRFPPSLCGGATKAMGRGSDPRAGEIEHLEHGLASALQTLQAIYNENLELRERMELVVALVDNLMRSDWVTQDVKGKLLEVIRTASPPAGQFGVDGPTSAASPPLAPNMQLEDDMLLATGPSTPARSSVSTEATAAEVPPQGANDAAEAEKRLLEGKAEVSDDEASFRLNKVNALLEAVIKTVDDGRRSGSPTASEAMAGTGEQPEAESNEDASANLALVPVAAVAAAAAPDETVVDVLDSEPADVLTRGRAVFSELFAGFMDGWVS